MFRNLGVILILFCDLSLSLDYNLNTGWNINNKNGSKFNCKRAIIIIEIHGIFDLKQVLSLRISDSRPVCILHWKR